MNEYYVYQLRVEDEELPFYVGKGKGDRAKHHLSSYGLIEEYSSLHKKNKIKKALREGKQILVEYIEDNLTEEQSFVREVFWIAHFGRADLKKGPLTNKTNGGEGVSGYIHTEESKKRLSEVHSGENNFFYGKTHTAESIEKMAAAKRGKTPHNKGKKSSPEAIAKMIVSKTGHRHKQESRDQMALSHSKTWIVVKPDGEEVQVVNLEKYCKENSLLAPAMRMVAYGQRNHHKGYKCREA